VGKQYKDSAYVHVSDLSSTIIMLSYYITLKVSHPDEIQNIILSYHIIYILLLYKMSYYEYDIIICIEFLVRMK